MSREAIVALLVVAGLIAEALGGLAVGAFWPGYTASAGIVLSVLGGAMFVGVAVGALVAIALNGGMNPHD